MMAGHKKRELAIPTPFFFIAFKLGEMRKKSDICITFHSSGLASLELERFTRPSEI